jgi:predicted transcriptional regulator
MAADQNPSPDYLSLTAEIVCAYVGNNALARADLLLLVRAVHDALSRLGSAREHEPAEAPVPAVPIRRSVTRDYMVCLEDGEKFRSLKRHLRSAHGMTPEQYRARWRLAHDYPMVAPSYAKARSELAKKLGLGQQRRKAAAKAAAHSARVSSPRKRGRKRAQ